MTRSDVSDSIARQIDEQVRVMVKHCYEETVAIVSSHRQAMDCLVESLIEKKRWMAMNSVPWSASLQRSLTRSAQRPFSTDSETGNHMTLCIQKMYRVFHVPMQLMSHQSCQIQLLSKHVPNCREI